MLRFVRRFEGKDDTRLDSLPDIKSRLLALRGMDTPEKARAFLQPDLNQLHDPYLMQDMDKAVALIRQAVSLRWPVVVYGDYDVDGVCATVLLMETLRALGADVRPYIPSRHEEGYGLHEQAVRLLSKECRLLITVDCGITGTEEVALAKELGMAVIITDHHQLGGEMPPADAVLNPLLGEYPFRRLCGAGVAFKLAQALCGLEGALPFIELAALATVADLVPLIEENRVLTAYGLTSMASTRCPGLKALMAVAGIEPEKAGMKVRSGQVAFGLAPRLNAGGRLQSASLGAELLLTDDAARARELAEVLDRENALRQKMEADIFQKAVEQVEKMDLMDTRALVVVGEGWNSGVIGLAASRLVEKYHYPTVVLAMQGETCVGSARSIPGVNIHAMLTVCRDLFSRFGGHEQAAGLTMKTEDVPAFQKRLSDAVRDNYDPEVFLPAKEYDLPLLLSQVDLEVTQTLESMQPTGFGNPEPVFLLKDAQAQDLRPVGREGAHLKLSLYQAGEAREAIAFRMGPMADRMPERVDVLFTPEANTWNGQTRVQCQVKAIVPAAGSTLHGMGAQEAFLQAAMQDIRALTANILKIPGNMETSGRQALAHALKGVQGTLILARTRETAQAVFREFGDRLDVAYSETSDPRCFHTLLIRPNVQALCGSWRYVVLADGEILPGEAAWIGEKLEKAKIIVLEKSQTLTDMTAELTPDQAELRNLYRALKTGCQGSLERLAASAGLTSFKALAGLMAFEELGLITYTQTPFSAVLLPPKKCRLEESALLSALWTVKPICA